MRAATGPDEAALTSRRVQVIGGLLAESPLGFRGTFVAAGLICAVAMACTVARETAGVCGD